jgi:hypothetical protein
MIANSLIGMAANVEDANFSRDVNGASSWFGRVCCFRTDRARLWAQRAWVARCESLRRPLINDKSRLINEP